MKYLALTAAGRPLLGDDAGFVPLVSLHPDLESVRAALPRATAGTLGNPADAPADRISRDGLTFGPA